MNRRLFSLARRVAAWIVLGSVAASADQIVLKDGREYSGSFVRGDASIVEFRILGRIEIFKISEIQGIFFKEPASAAPPEAAERHVPPQPPTGPSVTLPAGTLLQVRLAVEIDVARSRPGDTFAAALERPLLAGDQVLVPRGAETRGRITAIASASRAIDTPALTLTGIVSGGREYPLETGAHSVVPSPSRARPSGVVGGGEALVAILEAAAGVGKQAPASTEAPKLPTGTLLEFKLTRALTVSVP